MKTPSLDALRLAMQDVADFFNEGRDMPIEEAETFDLCGVVEAEEIVLLA